MYRTGTFRREMGMRTGPYTGGAVLVPWHAIGLAARRKLLAATPIAHERPRIKTWTLFALAVIAALGLVFVSGNGFGRVDERDFLQTRPHAILYGAFVAGIAIASTLLARRLFSGGSWLPWERAVLALDAIEATPRGLVVRPFGDARDVVFENGSLELRYADGSTFRIRAPDGERIERDLLFAEGILTRASLSEDDSVRVQHDPLAALRDDKGFSHGAHAIRISEKWTRPRELHPAMVALVILASFAFGVPLLELRNRWSDDAAFDYAHAQHTTRLYEEYLAHGSRHAVEVRDEILPSMIMSQLAMSNTDGVDDYLQRFPGAREGEVRGTLDRTCHALAADFFRKSSSDYMTGLQSFVDAYPACHSARGSLAAEHYDAIRLGLECEAKQVAALDGQFHLDGGLTCDKSRCTAELTPVEALRLTKGASMRGGPGVCSEVNAQPDATGSYAAYQDPCCDSGGSACTHSYGWVVSERARQLCVSR